jgi:DNA-binding response OmpR family regulator
VGRKHPQNRYQKNNMKTTILIIDDHASVRTMVADYLAEQGYKVLTASDGNEGLTIARRVRPDLVLLDIMMPGLDGFGFLRDYRRDTPGPVILLTARVDETDKVVGLELGADDYVTKPFGMKELVARIRAVLRRTANAQASVNDEILQVGDLVLNHATRIVMVNEQPVNLTPSEFALLALFMAAPGRVFSRELLLEKLQGNTYEGVERTIDVHIRNLRKKIETDPTRPRYIETVFGAGYRCKI